MEEPPQPSHDALPAALPHATPPSLDVATPPTARDDRDERQSDGQHERERDEHDVLGFGTAASEVEDGQVDSREGTNEVGTNEVQEEQAGEGGGSAADSTESSSLLARMDVKEGPAGDNEAKEAGEIDQVEEDKQGPRQKERPYHWQPSCIVPHRPPHTITGPFGEPLTLSPRSANMHQIDQAVYSDPLPGVPPPHQTTYEYRLFLPFRSLGNSIIGPKGFYITNIRMRSRVGVAQVLFTEEDRKAHVLFVGSLGSIKRALEEIEDLVYRKEWGRWNSWELDKLQTMSSDWIRFSRSRATEIPGLWLKPEYADDDPQCARGPEGGDRSTPWPANANAKYSRDRSLPARPPSTGRRHSHPLPTRPPQRYYGLSRGFPHQRERDGRGLPPRVVSGPSQPRPHEHSRRSRSPDRRAPPLSSTKPRGSRRSPSPDMRHSRARTPVLGDDDEDDRSRRRSSRSRSPVRSRVKSASSKSLSPERPRGPTRSLLAVEEQEDEEPPTSYSIDIGDESALHFFGSNSCAPYIQTTTGSKITVEASGVHVKVKVEGGDVQRALEKVREVVASTGGKIGGVAAGRKEGAQVAPPPIVPEVPVVSPKKRRYSSATARSNDLPETSFSSGQTADTSLAVDPSWAAREADLKEQVVQRMKERGTSTSGSVTPVEEPTRRHSKRREDRGKTERAAPPTGHRYDRRPSNARRSPLPLPPQSSAYSDTGRSYTHHAPDPYAHPPPAYTPPTGPHARSVPRWLNGGEQAFYDDEFRTKGWGWGSQGWHQSYSYEETKAKRQAAKRPGM